jgi:hypothetical protein
MLFRAMAVAQQPPPSSNPADEIVAKVLTNNAARAAQLRGYHSARTYELDYQGLGGHKHARMVVEMSFQAPHERKLAIVSESGSKTLLNHVLHKLIEVEQETNGEKEHADSEMNRANYRFAYEGVENVSGRNCYVLRVIPLRNNKLLFDGKIWVDTAEFAIVRIEAHPAKQPSVWVSQTTINHSYEKLGDFWLPVQNESNSRIRFGGRATLLISYQDYKIVSE